MSYYHGIIDSGWIQSRIIRYIYTIIHYNCQWLSLINLSFVPYLVEGIEVIGVTGPPLYLLAVEEIGMTGFLDLTVFLDKDKTTFKTFN